MAEVRKRLAPVWAQLMLAAGVGVLGAQALETFGKGELLVAMATVLVSFALALIAELDRPCPRWKVVTKVGLSIISMPAWIWIAPRDLEYLVCLLVPLPFLYRAFSSSDSVRHRALCAFLAISACVGVFLVETLVFALLSRKVAVGVFLVGPVSVAICVAAEAGLMVAGLSERASFRGVRAQPEAPPSPSPSTRASPGS